MHIMKFRNRNQKWSKTDVDILVRLMREHVPRPTIAAVLGRSEASLRHAIKNTLYQQLLHHMPADVLAYYNMLDNVLYTEVVNPVYYKELSASEEVSSSSEERTTEDESETEGDEDDGECESALEETQFVKTSDACDYITSSILSVVLAAGVAIYVHVLNNNWATLSYEA